ncbi:dTDP-glucose 4,6-dehydratase [Domibacillus enclensis]|uniref:dTDP-glucose 4,6-dehydratase n=1 Tax=Domibacillus enclensis TaxID=1017273 RepID=A0A1N6SCP9_9BACI|nr:dTDP-glucose 4,6-dehydratase [Domibacillus enclensis]OXS79286.1 dTDP-glucose 4,6-dehydratase [Domibacillus enclensis]SIQ38829.1 dTDP-glucose 4,6-dehydratase [Domibacillus enclensis]
MKYFVTGGSGFIGSNFIYYMFNKYGSKIKIVNIDKLTYAANNQNLNILPENLNGVNYFFEHVDITDNESMDLLFKKYRPDYVVNFAAETHVDRSIQDPKVFLTSNIYGTQVLMDLCLKYGVKRFHQVSTDEVYGSLENDGYFTEETPVDPSSPYSASKCAADLLCKSYGNTYNLPFTISRCSNNFGPYQFPEKLIPKAILNILRGEKVPLYGDGGNVRDWLYVDDHCEAIDLILHHSENKQIYNIGGNNEWTNFTLIKQLLSRLDDELSNFETQKNDETKFIEYVNDRQGHDRRYAIDSSKIQRELKWRPRAKFEDALDKTVDWYINNRHFYL